MRLLCYDFYSYLSEIKALQSNLTLEQIRLKEASLRKEVSDRGVHVPFCSIINGNLFGNLDKIINVKHFLTGGGNGG